MVTGSKGIHVVAPLKRTREAAWVRERAGELGAEIAERSPDTLTTEWRKEKRDGKILVDTARNTYGQTVVAPYAVRALPGRAGGDAAGVGRAVGPGAVRARVDAAHGGRAAGRARRSVGGHRRPRGDAARDSLRDGRERRR